MDYQALRRERLLKHVLQNDLHGFLVTHVPNVTYLTGFSGDSSFLLLGRDRTLLVSDGRYTIQLSEECPGLDTHIRPPSQRVTQAAAEVLNHLGWRRVGFESTHMSVADAQLFADSCPSVQWRPCEDLVENLRAIKDDSEVAAIREAIAIAERAFARLRSSLKPSDSEKQLGDRIEMLVREEGGRCTSFPPIVAVGERAALPHAPLTSRSIGDAELVLVDWGASGRFYRSDLTRVLTPRRISPKLVQVYEAVLRAQARAIQTIRPGVQAQAVYAEARRTLDEAGLGQFFTHGLGHGIGIDIHELPMMRPNNETLLEAGMVVTVEPGVYLADWGGVRIEDDVLITPDGCEVLTHVPRDLEAARCDI